MAIYRYFHLILSLVVSVLGGLLISDVAAAKSCPIPRAGETTIELCKEDQTEIPRGTCLEICIRGKMDKASLLLSMGQTTGSGFHFEMDNGPTTIETSGTTVLICSDSTSCGSAAIVMDVDGVATEIGSVRSSYGYWVFKDNSCAFSGPKTGIDGPYLVIERGGHKVMQWYDENFTIGSQAFEYLYYCSEGYGDCASRCQSNPRCDPVNGCLECVEFEKFPEWTGEFPCKDEHVRWKQYYISTLKCFCTLNLEHHVFVCPTY